MQNLEKHLAGTVTFLFTDIEGSTRLWEHHPAQMRMALARHDTLLRHIFEAWNGYVFKTVGDAFYVAFNSPVDALASALEAQRALLRETWGETPIRVRIGLHSGEAQERDGDYFGPPLNRAARLMSIGYGGQILLSQATRDLLPGQLPDGVEFYDLGRHRLKDLAQLEHVFQIVAPDLPTSFPPLRSLGTKFYNLPSQLTSFIGREDELEQLKNLLAPASAGGRHVRLLTLTGPGGIGKTRLALEAAAALAQEFEDGVCFVDLATINDAALVLPAIERALALRSLHNRSSLETISELLREKQLLLLLDNFEQVIGAANDVAALLSAVQTVSIIITSRLLLRIYGEVDYEVPSLLVPDPKRLPPLERLTQYEAIQLFSEQARAVRTGFTINSGNATAIAEICHRLDGLPLAIELTAARIRLLTPGQILEQLKHRMRFLSGGARNLPPRQRTLQGAIDWSYALLDPPEQLLFRRLGIFAGGCTYEAAERICNVAGDLDLLIGLESLIDHSLISQHETESEPRFIMLQTIHDYAQQRLESSGEQEKIREHHLSYFAGLAQDAQQHLELAEQSKWLDRLEHDQDNFSAAFRYAIDRQDIDRGLRLAQSLRQFWFARGYIAEGRHLLDELLALEMDTRKRVLVLDAAAFLARYMGDYTAAETYIGEELALARRLGDRRAIADSLANAGFIYLHQDQIVRAQELYTEALDLYQEDRNEQGAADTTLHLGLIATQSGNMAVAQKLYKQSLETWRSLGDLQGIAYAQRMLGDVFMQQGDYAAAKGYYRDSLQLAADLGFQLIIAASLEGLACLAIAEEKPDEGLKFASAAAELRKTAGGPVSIAVRHLSEQALALARDRLGDEAADAAWGAGSLLPLAETINEALGAF